MLATIAAIMEMILLNHSAPCTLWLVLYFHEFQISTSGIHFIARKF